MFTSCRWRLLSVQSADRGHLNANEAAHARSPTRVIATNIITSFSLHCFCYVILDSFIEGNKGAHMGEEVSNDIFRRNFSKDVWS